MKNKEHTRIPSAPDGHAVIDMKIRILIVDDEPDVTNSLRRFFLFEGYEVDVTNNPYEALKMVHEKNYLIVISDIAMPGMTGIELLERIKKYNGMIQVIMMTGYVTMYNILNCLRLGADECFLKPIADMGQLQRAVEDAINKLKRWKGILHDISKGTTNGGTS